MRKTLSFLAIALVSIVGLISCLNPIAFNPDDISLNLKVSGELDTRDVTAASTYIVNMSKTLDFTDVTVMQKENEKLANTNYLISQFNNTADASGEWKIIKTKYMQASDIEYEVGLTVQTHQPKLGKGSPTIKKWTDVYATQSRGVYYVWMYRTDDKDYIKAQIDNDIPPELADVVVVSPNDPNAKRPFPPPKPGDTANDIEINIGADNSSIVDALNKIANALINASGGNTEEKTAEEENGSVPPVISPKNRPQMGTFVVVNLSRTRNVDWVKFVDGGRTFTAAGGQTENLVHTINSVSMTHEGSVVQFPAVAAQDRRGIALLQGEYKIEAGHNGTQKTAMKTGLIVPSNDPQSAREHYIYFYKAVGGNYEISTEQPKDSDMDPTDVLPPSQGYGVGRITLVNKTTKAILEMVTLEARDHRGRGSKSYTYDYVNPLNAEDGFARKMPVGPNQANEVNVIGTSAFPIDGYFIASVKAVTADGDTAVTRLIYLNNSIAEIIVTDNDVTIAKVPGARITVVNSTTTSSVVNSVRIEDSLALANYQTYSAYISNGGTTAFDVLNSPGMPIIENEVYQAKVNVTVTKQFIGSYTVNGTPQTDPVIQISGTIDKTINPDGKLYGKNGPASNLKTITITEDDLANNNLVPATPPATPPFIPVSDVVILNGTYDTDGAVKFFAKDGQNRQIQWAVNPDNATARNPLASNNQPDGYWKAGVVEGTQNAAHYTISRQGVINVKSTYPNEFINVAFVMENGLSSAARVPGTYPVSSLLLDGIDPATDFVKVIKLKTPPPVAPPPPPPPPVNSANLILHVGGSSAGTGNQSFNLIEVYQRPPIVAAFTSPPTLDMTKAPVAANGYARNPGYITSRGAQTTYTSHQGDDAGALGYGSVTTGRTGWYWEEYPCDEFNDRFGSTSEGWLQGFIHGKAANLWNYPAPASPYKSMGFDYWGRGTTPSATHSQHFSGRAEPYFLGSVWLGGSGDPHAADRAEVNARSAAAGVSGAWVQQVSNDNRLNAPGEAYKLVVPTDQGKLWLRLRADEIWSLVGYRWKASTIYEWFVFDPATNYKKDSNGNVIIDITPFTEPYMRYRK